MEVSILLKDRLRLSHRQNWSLPSYKSIVMSRQLVTTPNTVHILIASDWWAAARGKKPLSKLLLSVFCVDFNHNRSSAANFSVFWLRLTTFPDVFETI